jgi:hypothetical protein
MQVSTLDFTTLTAQPSPEQFAAIEAYMREIEQKRGHVLDLATTDHFADNDRLYGRSVLIPADTVLLGGTHQCGSLCIAVGDITVLTEAGPRRLTGVSVVPTLAGLQRIGVTHADTFWISVHVNPTSGNDVAAIENALCVEAERLMTRRAPEALQ